MASETTSNDLRVDVQETASWSRRVSVTVPRERVTRVRRSVAAQIARNVRIPGFRKGKLPESLIEKQFGQSIDQETLDRVIQESYREVLDRHSLQPINQAQVVEVDYKPDADLVFAVEFEVQPKLDLSRVGGFVVPAQTGEVGEEEIDAVLERIRADRASFTAVPRKPDFGDEVTVDIAPTDHVHEEGEEHDHSYRFVLGEGQAIPDIENAIMTLEPGGEGEFHVRFPDDFPDEEQRGKEQDLRIRLDEVRERSFPALDDEFAKSLGDEFETMDALRDRVRTDLRADAGQRAEAGLRGALINQILEANPFEVPTSMVDRYLDYMTGEGEGQKKRQLTPEQEEQRARFRDLMRPQAETALKRMLVVEHLADREQLRATQDEVDERVEKLAGQYGRTASDVWLELEKSGQLQALESEITEEKVFAWLKGQSTVG